MAWRGRRRVSDALAVVAGGVAVVSDLGVGDAMTSVD
jgi:hypothetical protein